MTQVSKQMNKGVHGRDEPIVSAYRASFMGQGPYRNKTYGHEQAWHIHFQGEQEDITPAMSPLRSPYKEHKGSAQNTPPSAFDSSPEGSSPGA
jgi:hypothetical protein